MTRVINRSNSRPVELPDSASTKLSVGGGGRAYRPALIIALILAISVSTAQGQGFGADASLEQYVKIRLAESRKVTARQLNLFHRRFVEKCMPVMPKKVELQYVGLLGTDNGRLKSRIADSLGDPLGWSVQDDVVLFSFWISTRETKESVTSCTIEDVRFYVNVDFIDGNRGLDTKIPKLGDHSVREVVSKLEEKRRP